MVINDPVIFHQKVRQFIEYSGNTIVVIKGLFFDPNKVDVFLINRDFIPPKYDIQYYELAGININELFIEGIVYTETEFNTKISEMPLTKVKLSSDTQYRWFT